VLNYKQPPHSKAIVSFIVLFLLYHAAEYMILFKNNIPGYFVFHLLFFSAAYLLGNWYNKNGLAAWGLPFIKGTLKLVGLGTIAGIFLYGIPYAFTMISGNEKVVNVPEFKTIILTASPFVFGVIFSSVSEDLFTRGIVINHLRGKVNPIPLVLLSALIYVLNHIYRLGDGLETLLYLFLLGVVFAIPVVFTKKLWFIGAMHWAGNSFFYIFYNVIQTDYNKHFISSNYLFSVFLVLCIPIIWLGFKKNTDTFSE
jgi:membrane protease YdiL (CAAX protease family)